MKKILLATSVALPFMAVSSFAGDCHPKAHGGFAVGLHGGYVTAENRFSSVFSPTGALGARNDRGTTDLSGRGGLIGLDLSYGHVFSNKLFAGLELKADLQSVKGTIAQPFTGTFGMQNTVTAKDSFGAALKLGGLVDKALPYISVGVVTTKFETQSQAVIGVPLGGDTKLSKRLTGFELGLGIDLPVSERITVGGRYLHTEYGSMTRDFRQASGVARESVRIKPRTNAFLLNVKYRVW